MTIFKDNYLAYTSKSISIVPIMFGTKRPLAKEWSRWSSEPQPEVLLQKWANEYPTAGIGMVCGKQSNIVVLDIDVEPDSKAGKIIYPLIKSQIGTSPIIRRGSKGYVLIYKYSGEKSQEIKMGDKQVIDILSDKRQVVMPPSIHPDTNVPYEFTPSVNFPHDFRIEDLPTLGNKSIELLRAALNQLPTDTVIITEGRNNTLKSQVTAALNKNKDICTIKNEIIYFDSKNHNPPLFSDNNDPQMKGKTNDQNAEIFVRNIATSLKIEIKELPDKKHKHLIPWPEEIGDNALIGLTGEIINTIFKVSESGKAALLFQFLIAYGNLIGRTAHWYAESTAHYTNVFALLVGRTAGGRKGTSWDRVADFFKATNKEWFQKCVQTGASSGEGLIYALRDPRPNKVKTLNDPGVTDKRLLDLEPEFSSLLKNFKRENNKLSDMLRKGWDGSTLATLTRKEPLTATDPHISVVGHITEIELAKLFTETEAVNGLGNRFLLCCTQRSKLLPEAKKIPESKFIELTNKLGDAIDFATQQGDIPFDQEAKEFWVNLYAKLSNELPGLVGSMTARGAPQVRRVALIYALLDSSPKVKIRHLKASLAVWKYSLDSAKYIFGEATGDKTADIILNALKDKYPEGLPKEAINNVLGRNKSAADITISLTMLERFQLIISKKVNSNGKNINHWFYNNQQFFDYYGEKETSLQLKNLQT